MRNRSLAILVLLFAIVLTAAPIQAGASINLLVNPGFEGTTRAQPNGWSVVNPAGDKLRCNFAEPIAQEGVCSYQFKGGPTPTTLQQSLSEILLNEINLQLDCGNALLESYVHVLTANTTKLRLSVKVKYTNGNADYSVKINEDLSPLLDTWSLVGDGLIDLRQGTNLTKVVFSLKHSSAGGKTYVDNANLKFSLGPSVC